MNKYIISEIFEIAEAMCEKVFNGCNDVTFIGCYEDAASIIKDLLIYDETYPYQISIEPEDWDRYDKEYLITLDNEMNIWCEKAYQEEYKRYLSIETGCAFVADDCNSAILKNIKSDELYEVSYDLEDECECDSNCGCCNCDSNHEVITRVVTDEDGKLKGFEKSWETHEDGLNYHSTYSFYSSNHDMLKDMLENFNIKY